MNGIERDDRILEELSYLKKKIELVESGLSQLSTKVDANHIAIQLQLSKSQAEMYRIEAQRFRVGGGMGSVDSPFKMEIAPQCVGNSPTNPDYEIFLDRDYGIN